VKIAEIARRQRIPQKFLELILAGLKQGGFVESRRGAEGGYLLARPAEAITVGQIVRYMESGTKNGARKRAAGPLSAMWSSVDQAVSNVVDQTNFGDLARAWRDKQGTYIPNWEI
jgi:Rrf2 family protein